MAFRFKKKESVAKAIRRLGTEQIESAFKNLRECDEIEAIHSMRKSIKKSRAILRLVQQQVGSRVYQRQTKGLREAAGHLAPARDAHVRLQAFDDLIKYFEGRVNAEDLMDLRKILQKDCRKETARFQGGSVRVTRQLLRQVERRFKNIDVDGSGWAAVSPGLQRIYRAGRKGYRRALEDSTPENLHEWRKRVKDLWYHVRLLGPMWCEQMDAVAQELKMLSEYLGDDHDLVMLEQYVSGLKDIALQKSVEILTGLISVREQELRTAAFALGARFYAEKPSVFCNRLGSYWQIWRGERKKRIVELAPNHLATGTRPA